MRLLQGIAGSYGRGDLQAAEELCGRLLQLHPDHVDALHVLGLIAWRRGDRPRALAEIRGAIASDPARPQPHNSLGVVLKELGDLDGAEAAFRMAVDLKPDYPDALTNLGNILSDTGRLAEAEAMHRRVLAVAPNYGDGHANLATVLSKQERWEEAVEECRIAVALSPNRAEFHLNHGNAIAAAKDWPAAAAAFRRAAELAPDNADAHANLGIALYHLDQPGQAAAAHRVATELRPQAAHIWANLAAAQVDLGDADAALASARRALELDPNLPEAHNSVGLALGAKDRCEEAMSAYETAVRLRPTYHKAYNNIGALLYAQGRFREALGAYDKAVVLMPSFSEARWNKGVLHLLQGEFEAGWRGYEHGLDMKHGRACFPNKRIPMWRGEVTAEKTMIMTGEQGIGDQIMFVSLLPDLIEHGATCVAMLDDRLRPLLGRSIRGLTLIGGEEATLASIGELAADFWAPIGGLCRWLRPDLASFPARSAYLKADPTKVARLRSHYRRRFGDRPVVGISWRGGIGRNTRLRSIPLVAWAPILARHALGFVNLQYGDCGADLAEVRRDIGVDVLHDDTVDPLKSLDDFAAQTAAMDLVISIDNSTVHMAGALGVPVWALIPFVPDWRWMLGRSDSPWYSSVRLFRQAHPGAWAAVIEEVAEELKKEFGIADRGALAGGRSGAAASS